VLVPILVSLSIGGTGCGDGSSEPDPPGDEVRDCDPSPGVICTWAGTGEIGWDGDGHHRLHSAFYWPIDITFASTGEAYIVDWNNHKVRLVEADQTLRTVIGTNFEGDGPEDNSDQVPPGAVGYTVHLNHPTEFSELPDGRFLLTGWHTHKMRVYDPVTELVMVTCGAGPGFAGDGGPARLALLERPIQSAIAPDGTIFILDQTNQRIRRITPDDSMIDSITGTGVRGFSGDGGSPALAQMNQPPGTIAGGGLDIDSEGRLYFSDIMNFRIRRIDLALDRIETIAGTGVAGYSGDGGPATAAQINNVREIQFGPDGKLYLADERNDRVRAIDLTTGVITTVAGNGVRGFSGDGGPATEASLNGPIGLGFDGDGNLYIADAYNQRIRRVTF
jgi:hypothetical protein